MIRDIAVFTPEGTKPEEVFKIISKEAGNLMIKNRLFDVFNKNFEGAHDAFNACDADKNGYITRDEFKKILREYGFYALDSELTWLVDRYDRNRDGRISYSEFIDEILPKSPSRR